MNPSTNQIYIANSGSNYLTVISDDGSTHSIQDVQQSLAGTSVAVDTATNQVYVANSSNGTDSWVTIQNGSNLSAPWESIDTGAISTLMEVGVNPVTHKFYVVNDTGNSVSIFDGATNVVAAPTVTVVPSAVAVDPVRNLIYVTNSGNASVAVIDGNTNELLSPQPSITVGTNPDAIVVDPINNVIYVANAGSSSVTVIDGSTIHNPIATTETVQITDPNAPFTISPDSLALNPVLGQIFGSSKAGNAQFQFNAGAFGNQPSSIGDFPVFGGSNPNGVAVNTALGQNYVFSSVNDVNGSNFSVFDTVAGNGTIESVCQGGTPNAMDVNPVTNSLYVGCSDNSIRVIQGADGFTGGTSETMVSTGGGSSPSPVVVNPVTNMVYVGGIYQSSMYVIDGSTNTYVTAVGSVAPVSIAVNQATNKIYVLSQTPPSITIVDGATNTVLGNPISLSTPGSTNTELGVNPVTGKIYGLDSGANTVNEITENAIVSNALTATINPLPPIDGLPPNSTNTGSPAFTFSATNNLAPTHIVNGLYFQVDSQQGNWTTATLTSPGNFSGTASNLTPGFHILYAYATDGEDTLASPAPFGGESSPQVGTISSYGFLVDPPIAVTNFYPGAFPSVGVGSSSSVFNPILINSGGSPLNYSFEITGPNASDFVVNPSYNSGFTPCPTPNGTLAAASVCAVNIFFNPTIIGPESATLTFIDDSLGILNSVQTVSLTGTGVTQVHFSNLTPSQSVQAGPGFVNLSGTISDGVHFPPPSAEFVTITIGPASQQVTIGGSGEFINPFDTSSIPASVTPYPITYSYPGDGNLGPASDSSTTLTVTSFASPATASVTLLGTGDATVSTNVGGISCTDTNGAIGGTCSGTFPSGSITFTATPMNSATFAGWGGACANSFMSLTCTLTNPGSSTPVTANFVAPPITQTVTFNAGANVSGMATFDCPDTPNPGPGNPCVDPNAHSLALTIPSVSSQITLNVTATEFSPTSGSGNGDCTNGSPLLGVTDFDCRFATFFTYATQGGGDRTVPLCIPYANGNCVFYTVNTGTPGAEPDPSTYAGTIGWQVSWNNDVFVPPSGYAGSTPRLYEDPDGPLTPSTPYGTNCAAGMTTDNPANTEPYACQFEFDITTSYDPTKPVDATVGGKTKQFSDVVVAYPPAFEGQLTATSQADQVSPAPGSPIGFTISVFNNANGPASGVTLNDLLPAGTGVNWAISPAYSGLGSCSITGAVGSQILACPIGAMSAQASTSVHVASASSSVGVYTNAATVSAADQQVLAVATINVTKPTPTYKSLTPSQAIAAGPGSINLSGTISFGPNNFPANGETFNVKIGSSPSATGLATIGSNGTFTALVDTTGLPANSTPYDISYNYGGDANLAAAIDSSTSLLVTSFAPESATVKLFGTGTGSVSDDQNQVYCAEDSGIEFGTCVAGYDPNVTSTITLTATPDASSSTTFGGWGGDCAFAGNSTTCQLAITNGGPAYFVTANFVPPPVMKNLSFPPSITTTTKMATFDCTMNVDPSPENPCIDPNAHSIALTIPQVITPFTMTVVATEFAPTDGNCPSGSPLINETDFDCRFAKFFGATQGNGDRTVPLCDPYANGNCIHYQIYYGAPGTEPPQSAYAGNVNWTISWNNDQYVPPAPYSQSTPRLFEDPDGPVQPTDPYGSDCTKGMTLDSPPTTEPYACQFEFDITTSYDPTKKVDATVGGKTKQFSDVVVAFPPAEFTSLTPSQAITQGAAPITLSGNVGVGSSFPSLGETVTISINGVTQTTTISGSNGAFSTPFDASSIPSSPVPYPITYSYAGDPTLEPATDSSTTLTVNASALETTTTMVTSSPSNPAYGDPITLTVTVDPNSVPTGSVQATIDGAKFGSPVQLTPGGSGTSTCPSDAACATIGPITTLGSGTHTIIVTYIPTGNFTTSSVTLNSFNVSGASVTPSVTANDKVYDGTTTATIATCTLANVQPTDAGNVTCSAAGPNTFSDKNVGAGKTVTATGITLAGPAKGNYQLSSTTATTTASITARATSVAVGLSPNSVTVGGGSTVTVTVSDTSAAPTFGPAGMIALTSSDTGGSGDTFSACTLSNANPAMCTATVTTHEIGTSPHAITATYTSSDGIHTGSNGSSPLAVTAVAQAATTVAVAPSVNPSVFGQSVTFTATITVVSPGTGHPASGETVTFKDGVNTLGTGLTNGSGVATFSTSSLSVAAHSITAVYPGDASYTGNTSPAITQNVNKANTSTALTSSANASVFGQSVTFTATITTVLPGVGLPASSETVTFKDGATTLGTGLTNSSGVATLSTATLSVASHSITAVYAGDSNLNTSTSSPALSQVVNKAATTTTITSSLATATVVGQAYSVAYNVTVNAPGGGTITGTDTVSVSDGSATCTATVTAGTCQLTSTTPGVKTITATFGGDASYSNSTSLGVSHTVNQPPTINSANATTFTQGTLGSFTVTATGFPASFTFSQTGSLPNGVTLSTAGVLSGTPTASGTFPITITVSNGISPNGTQSFTLTVNPAAGSALKFSPATLDFGTVYAGSFTLRSTTITNTGTSMVTFTKFSVASISGDDSNGFVGVDFCPKTLNAGKSCTIIMSFTADSNVTKTHAANLVVTDTASGSPQTILMSATVINPGASVSPSSINFGTEKVNSITTKPVTLTNSGTTALNISSIAITGSNAADFQTSACGSTLAPGAHCTITVTFKPLSKSSFSASLTITDNASSGKQTVSLSGKGN